MPNRSARRSAPLDAGGGGGGGGGGGEADGADALRAGAGDDEGVAKRLPPLWPLNRGGEVFDPPDCGGGGGGDAGGGALLFFWPLNSGG